MSATDYLAHIVCVWHALPNSASPAGHSLRGFLDGPRGHTMHLPGELAFHVPAKVSRAKCTEAADLTTDVVCGSDSNPCAYACDPGYTETAERCVRASGKRTVIPRASASLPYSSSTIDSCLSLSSVALGTPPVPKTLGEQAPCSAEQHAPTEASVPSYCTDFCGCLSQLPSIIATNLTKFAALFTAGYDILEFFEGQVRPSIGVRTAKKS